MAAKNEFDENVATYMKLATGFINSFILKAVVDLGIADILNSSESHQLTLDEIAAKLPSKTVNVGYLDRIMTFAALQGIFAEVSSSGQSDEIGQKQFRLTPLSSIMVQKDGSNNLVDLARMVLSKVSVEPFLTFSDAVLTGVSPFKLAHGEDLWDYGKTHPDWDGVFNKAMVGHSTMVGRSLLQSYRGFEGVKVLVDVGGGAGAMVTSITRAYPDIRCINFDQPHVIAVAPEAPGVTHVGGDMFQSVPEGDAILMKHILHDWTDQDSIQILKNCYKALPQGGKVILVEMALAEPKVAKEAMSDIMMLGHTIGRERTGREWHQILKECGFSQVEITPFPSGLSAIEGYKS